MDSTIPTIRIEQLLHQALQEEMFREQDTAIIIYDMDFLAERIQRLVAAFPSGTLHAMAVKANPLLRILEHSRTGVDVPEGAIAVEAASMGEVHIALAAGFKPSQIVFDSPVKTIPELEFALTQGIHLNIDNLTELERVNNLLKNIPSSSTIGIRVNPQVGTGTIAESSVAGLYSKFGVPIGSRREELAHAFNTYPWLRGVHLHVGSQGCAMEMLVNGIGILYDFIEEVNIGRSRRNLPPADTFDIGGGLPIAYLHGANAPAIEDYIRAVFLRAPGLGKYRLITEFGRWIFTHSGFTVSRVEYVKHDPEISTAMIHVGADLFVRECLNPKDWQHEYSVFNRGGKLKDSLAGDSPENQDLKSGRMAYNLAGPLCFSGDIIARGVMLPEIMEGDLVAIRDTGGYTFSMWSHYNSRQSPRIIGYSKGRFSILKERQSLPSIVEFWK